MDKQYCTTLKRIWKDYVTVDVEDIEARGRQIDIFLNKFLYFHKKFKFDVCPEFSDLTSVGNILSRQFLTDILYVHPSNQDAKPEEDFSPLIHYLLEGRGWKILWIIKLVGVQTLSCNKALADLLVSLFPVYSHLPAYNLKNEDSSSVPTGERVLENLEGCFQSCLKHLEAIPKKTKISQSTVLTEVYVKENFRKFHHSKSDHDYLSFINSSDSENPITPSISAKRQLVHFRLNPVDFMYFSKPGTKSSEELECSEHLDEDLVYDDKEEEIDLNSSPVSEPMNSLEFCENVTNLLQNICERDDSFKGGRNIPVSANILSFALEMLLSLQHGNGFVESWSLLDVLRIKQHFVHLVFTSASSLIALSNKSIEQFSLVSKLLMHAEDLFNQLSLIDNTVDNYLIRNELLLLVFNIVFGCLYLLCIISKQSIRKRDHAVLQNTLNILEKKQNKLSNFLTGYETITSGQQKQFFLVHLNRLLHTMGKTLISLKYNRSHYWHSRMCKKKRHKHCSIDSDNYHHRELYDSSNIVNKQENIFCCISSFISLLSEIYSLSLEASTQMIILVSLKKIGLCCCLNMESMLQKLLTSLNRQTPFLRQIALNFIETTFMKHLGGTESVNSSLSFCELCQSKQEATFIMIENLKEVLSNKTSITPEEFYEFLNTQKTSWEALRLYRNILIQSDLILVHQIVKHILQISNFSNYAVKSELFLRVVLPILYPNHHDFYSSVTADHVLICCLGSLCTMLKHTTLSTIFLDKGGLQILHFYLNFNTLRPLVLKILILLITAEINRNPQFRDMVQIPSKEKDNISDFVKSLQSVKAFQSILLDHNAECISTMNVLMNSDEDRIKNDLLLTELGHQLDYEADLWSTCSILIGKCSAYKVYCQNQIISSMAYETLMLLIGVFSNGVLAPVFHDRTLFSGKLFRNLMSSLESLLSVCLSLCPFSLQIPDMQEVDISHLIQKVNYHLECIDYWNSTDLRLLMEMFLRVGTGKLAFIKFKSEQAHLEMFLPECDEADYSDVEFDDTYTAEALPCETDDGYDADVELPDTDSDKHPAMINNIFQNVLVYPDLSNVVLHVLSKISKNIKTNKNQEAVFEARTVISVLKYLINLCKDNKKNCIILYNQNIFKVILQDYSHIFLDDSVDASDLQSYFMEIFVIIAEYIITSEDFKLFIKLFKLKQPVLQYLLVALQRLVMKSPIQPSYILGFHLRETNCYSHLTSHYDSIKPPQDIKLNSCPFENNAIIDRAYNLSALLHTQHLENKNISSSWNFAVCAFPVIGSDFNLHQQFSLSLWFGLSSSNPNKYIYKSFPSSEEKKNCDQKNSASSTSRIEDGCEVLGNSLSQGWDGKEHITHNIKSCIHMVSLGCDSKLFEVWLIPNICKILLRITNSSSHTHTVLSETVSPLVLKNNDWHHLGISYEAVEVKNMVVCKITIIINGVDISENNLKFVNAFTRNEDTVNLMLIGHEHEDPQFLNTRWYLGNLSLFKGIVLTQEMCLNLFALGPDTCSSLSVIDDDVYFSPLISSQLIQYGLNPRILNKAFQTSLHSLQNSLILFYTPQKPDIVTIYAFPQRIDSSSQKDSAVGIPVRSSGIRFLGDDHENQIVRNPLAVGVKWLNKAEHLHFRSFNFSVTQLGGVSFFMLLLSHVFEHSKNEDNQALMLKIFLYYCGINADNRRAFLQIEGPSLLAKVFSSSKCIISYQLFKEITDACLSSNVIDIARANKNIALHHSKKSIIVDKELFTIMAISWKVWEKETTNISTAFLAIVNTLVNKDHPYHEFNIQQLKSQNFIKKLLITCKEWIIHLGKNLVSSEMCSHLISIVEIFLGAQPKCNLLAEICDFILLFHPAVNTSISYARHSFYFNLMPSPKPLAISKSSPVSHPSNSDMYCDMPVIPHIDDIDDQIVSDIKPDSSLPVDPNKLTKSITNLHIKQTGEKIKESTNREPSLLDIKTTQITHEEEIDNQANIKKLTDDEKKMDQGMLDDHSKQSHQDIAYQDHDCKEHEQLFTYNFSKFVEEPLSSDRHVKNLEKTDEMSGDGNFEMLQKESHFQQENLFYVKALYDSHEDNENSDHSSSNTTPEIISSTELDISSEDWEVLTVLDSEDRSVECDESSAVFLCSELLNLLTETIQQHSDHSFMLSLGDFLKPEMILVIVHSPDHNIRSSAIKLLNVYLQQASDEVRNGFLKMKGFLILGNQLHQYPASEDVVQECFSIFLNKEFTFEDGCHSLKNLNKDPICQASVVIILSVLPNSHHDIALCHNILCTLSQLCDNITPLLQLLIQNSLLEALMKLLGNIIHSSPRFTDVVDSLEQDILLNDVKLFLNKIITYAVSGKDNIHFPTMNVLLALLSYIEKKDHFQYGIDKAQVMQIRDIKCYCLQNALNCLHDMTSHHMTVQSGNNQSTSREEVMMSPSLTERFQFILTKAVDFATIPEIVDNEIVMSDIEKAFIRFLTQFMIQALAETQKKLKRRLSNLLWNNEIRGIRDKIRLHLAKLLVYLLAPTQILEQRLFVISVILKEKQPQNLLNIVIHLSTELEGKFSLYLQELSYCLHYNLSMQEKAACYDLLKILKSCNVVVQNVIPVGDNLDFTKETKQKFLEETISRKSIQLKNNEILEQRILLKHENIIKEITENAMAITHCIVEKQNASRKLFLEVINQMHRKNLQIYQMWQQLIRQLTHERAIWNYPEYSHHSWQLDSTEGPCRERRRLQPCRLAIDDRYFLPEFCKKDFKDAPLPFSYLYEEDALTCDSSVFTDYLRTKDKIRYTACCRRISPGSEIVGEVLVGEMGLYFVGEEAFTDKSKIQDGKKTIISLSWPYNEIKEVLKRRYELQENAIEIFLICGKNSLIAFSSTKEREKMFSYIMDNNLPNVVESKDLLKFTHLWQDGAITNFEYLMFLNKLAGRTFNDLMQYPVFPFVLSEYKNSELNLKNPSIYRNFSKPMAIQEKRNEQRFIDTYNYLKNSQREGTMTEALMPITGPYHYGSHYSNSGIVLHFLVRLPPFTQIFLKYQDRNFDIPDRTFHSVHTSWCLSSHDSNTDIKELIPEFFFMPEFLMNSEGFDFGYRQSGERVHDVLLPPWCKNDPRLFVLIHRQALESDYVTQHLHLWIDLIFGCKQLGKAAVEAVNVFHPATYYGFDLNTIEDPIRREAVRTMIKTFGQTPKQLFTTVHPMVSISLLGEHQSSSNIPLVLSNIKGLKWGSFVGSPAAVDSTLVWCHSHHPPIRSFVSILTNDVFGLVQNCCLLLNYAKEKGASLINITYVTSVALITWGHPDGNLRIKLRKDQSPSIFLKGNIADPICCCASNPDSSLLFVGYYSGIVMVYKVSYETNKVDVGKNPYFLFGHVSPITTIQVCHAYSIVLTTSQSGDCIIWDLNKLCYVRSITSTFNSIQLAAINNVTGDFALVSQKESGIGSILQMYTINARLIGMIQTNVDICSVCFSSAPEGVSVNVIATGMFDGSIQFWSTWDLSSVSSLRVEKEILPFVCVAYSADSQYLYAANSGGLLFIWENGKKKARKPPKYHTIL